MNTAAIENLMTRRSVRAFTEQMPSRKDLETIVNAALYAPSGMNTQEWLFTVVQNAEVLRELNEGVKACQPQRGADYCCHYHAPVLIIASHRADSPLACSDCACALENMFLAAHALGLGSCWINQIGQCCNEQPVRAVLSRLGVPENHAVYGCAAIGYAAGELPQAKPRREGTVLWR